MDNFSKKVVFFDIDGTLVSKNRTILPSTIKIIKDLYKTGEYDFYISTGRSYHTLREIEPIKPYLKGYIIANGGELILDNKLIMFDYINNIDSDKIIRYLMNNKISFGILSTKRDYMYFYDEKILKDFEHSINQKVENYADKDVYPLGQVVQIWVFAKNEILDKLKEAYPKLEFFYWRHYGSDVVPYNRNKGTGIKTIIQYMGYDYNKTYAFGDSSNDISMFKQVKFSFAMANAKENIKEAASFVTDDYNNDGIYQAFKNYIIKDNNDINKK